MDINILLQILACPVCKGDLDYLDLKNKQGFACNHCQKVYPIKDDIPVMLIEEAESLGDWKAKESE